MAKNEESHGIHETGDFCEKLPALLIGISHSHHDAYFITYYFSHCHALLFGGLFGLFCNIGGLYRSIIYTLVVLVVNHNIPVVYHWLSFALSWLRACLQREKVQSCRGCLWLASSHPVLAFDCQAYQWSDFLTPCFHWANASAVRFMCQVGLN